VDGGEPRGLALGDVEAVLVDQDERPVVRHADGAEPQLVDLGAAARLDGIHVQVRRSHPGPVNASMIAAWGA
jgi:hypothetical protein